MREKSVLVIFAVACLGSIGYCSHLSSENAKLMRSNNELSDRMQKLRGSVDEWNGNHPFPQDSITAFRSNYGADLLKSRYLAQVYSKDRSEGSRQQLQQALDGFALYVHAWQQLITATAPMLNASIPKLMVSGQTGDMVQLEKALGDLDQIARTSGAELNGSVTNINNLGSLGSLPENH